MNQSKIAILLSLSSLLSLTAHAVDFTVSGVVTDEFNQPLAGVSVSLADKNMPGHSVSNKQGQFSIGLHKKDVYQLRFSKAHHYSSVQTFSYGELSGQGEFSAQGQLAGLNAPVTLVAQQPGRVMLAFGGDVMMGRRYYRPYFGDEVLLNATENDSVKTTQSRAIVEHIKPYMSLADLASVNLETQIAQSKPEQRASKFVTFFSRPQTLDALAWAGIDYVSLGNNHTYDYLKSGLASTMTFLQDSSLGFSGAGFNQQQALKAYRTKLNNTSLSLLGYVGWEGSSQPTQTATSDHGGAAYGSMANILASVEREVQQNRVTILQYHGSQEYANNPTGVTEQRLKSALDAGGALAIAHHPHVTQGIELYDGKLIAYSMGNFIFDQNFSATQHSFILYVWLDEGKFSRAEIVPLYIKGYKPTPATGMHRHILMKRLTALSGARGTVISRSGGHGVITSDNKQTARPEVDHKVVYKVRLAANERTASLYHLPWERQLTQIEGLNGRKYRLGVNLINGSDFESFASFNSRERGWLYDKSAATLNDYGYSGQHSLALILAPSKPAVFGMQSFRRVYSASQPMTIKARIKTGQKVRARFYWQGRKNRQKLMDALQNGEKHLIATKELHSGADWQSVEVDFNSPRVGYRGYRILVEFELLDGAASQVDGAASQVDSAPSQLDIDDFALIEWQTAYSARPEPALLSDKSRVVTYIGLDKPSVEPLTLTLR